MASDRQDDETFLSRWARRKQAVREAEETPEPAGEAPNEPAQSAAASPQAATADDPDRPLTEEEVAALPDPDTLGPGADFKAFLRKGVPEELRRRALRRLWRSNPVFSVLDGMAEYDLDYTDAATVVANIKTAFQVGRGMILPEEEEAERAAKRLSERSAPAASAIAAEADADTETGAQAESEVESEVESGSEPQAKTLPETGAQPATDNPERDTAVYAPGAVPNRSRDRSLREEPMSDPGDVAAPEPVPDRPKGRAAQRRWGGFAAVDPEGRVPETAGEPGPRKR